ncbi:MAG: ABC transporter ATP-binding protein/permease [Rickettsiales bacterium]|jgi:ATP-binding cassette subfamily B protein|nr:ABC transporter ATP-binding protein/permease [Rickettsiales bacterium]
MQNKYNNMKGFLRFIGEYRKYAILAPLCVAGEASIAIFIPHIMAQIIDVGTVRERNISFIIYAGVIMAIISFISLLLGALAGKFAAKGAMGFAKNIRQAIFNKIQSLSFSNMDRFSTASLITRITTDVFNIQNAFMFITRAAFRSPLIATGATIMAIYTNPKMAKIFLFAIPFLASSLFVIAKIAYFRFKILLEEYDKMNLTVQENLIGIRFIKAFTRENYENKKFKKISNLVRRAQIFAEKIIMLEMPIMLFVVYSCVLAVLYFGGNLTIRGEMAIGQLASFLTYIMQILNSLMMLYYIFMMIVISKASRVRILEILNEEPNIKDGEEDAEFKDSSIEFKDVSFSYNNKADNLVFEKINLTVESGTTLGIIGSTASGKSALVQLLPRLYDILDGKLIIGGNDIKSYKLDNLRNKVAMVLQKNVLFSGTIKENLKWGNETATDDEIAEACKISQAHDFVMSFPQGYNTKISQGGSNLSGGQKQRLCIARAILKKPRILILDDSTSAVDTATEAKIRDGLKNILPDTTKIIVAQRILSIKDANKIVVLSDGNIDGCGTHQELLNNNSLYKDIYYSQQAGITKR